MSNSVDLVELGGVPIDRNALYVTMPGIDFVPKFKTNEVLFDVQPPMKEVECGPLGNSVESLVGLKVGRLTVVGYWGRVKSNGTRGKGGQKWVCRCTCGMYTVRTGKRLKNPVLPDRMMCANCDYFEHLKRKERFLRTGRYGDENQG